jgi:hydrogenase maturation protease
LNNTIQKTILVLGIGQSLRGDDAAGLDAVRLWQETYPGTATQVQVGLSELPGLGLLDLLHDVDAAILVDAVKSSAAPGTIHRLEQQDLDAFAAGSGSAHGWGVAETLKLGRSLDPALAETRIILVGIEVGSVEMGAGLSPQVQSALPMAAEMIEHEIQALL